MKVITWNCKMKFREDLKTIFPEKPDILVVAECESIDRLNLSEIDCPKPTDSIWIGDNQSKGLAIFTFNDFKIELYENYSDNYKYILPVTVSRKDESYRVIGVWTKKVGPKKKGHLNYIRQAELSLTEYDSFLDHENVIVCGDFNSNLIWPKTGIDKNHQIVLDQLSSKNIYSSYHYFYDEEQGKESSPTYYHYHKIDNPFHIDFCFLSEALIKKLKSVQVGEFKDWMSLSDHVPMAIEL